MTENILLFHVVWFELVFFLLVLSPHFSGLVVFTLTDFVFRYCSMLRLSIDVFFFF